MSEIGPKLTPDCPQVSFEGRNYPLTMDRGEWRLRSRTKWLNVTFRTGTSSLREAQKRAKEFLAGKLAGSGAARKGGGMLEHLARVYLETPKRTKEGVAQDNVSALRSIVRKVSSLELERTACRVVGPEFWQKYQRVALETRGLEFNLTTRYRENIAINARVRAARCLFLSSFATAYRDAGLEIRSDAGECVMLPEPYLPPSEVDDAEILRQWRELPRGALWLVIGLARFAGLRREEISAMRPGWIEVRDGVVTIALRDRPEEGFWTKTGKPYRAQVIDAEVAEWLQSPNTMSGESVVPDPPEMGRDRWFEREPQRWLKSIGVESKKPLHRLRGLFADHIAKLTADAVAARLAGVKAAQTALGHTSSATTEAHYLSPEG